MSVADVPFFTIKQIGTRPALVCAVAGSMLWSLQEFKGVSQKYMSLFRMLATDVDSREWITLTMLAPAWSAFMEKCFTIRSSLESSKTPTDSRVITDKVAQEFLEEIKKLQASKIPSTTMNALLAATGLGMALPESAYAKYEAILDMLQAVVVSEEDAIATNDLVRYSALIGIGMFQTLASPIRFSSGTLLLIYSSSLSYAHTVHEGL